MLLRELTYKIKEADGEQPFDNNSEEEYLGGTSSEIELINQNINSGSGEIPEWSIDDFWEYDLTMVVDVGITNIELIVRRMELKVTEITSDEYILSIFGYIESFSVSDYNYFHLAPSKFVSGLAYIDKDTLSMKKFSLSLEGNGKDIKIGPLKFDIIFDIEFLMEFNPYLDFLNFPINVGNSWNLETVLDFSINGYVEANGASNPIEFNFPDVSINEELSVVTEEEVTVPAGNFNSFKITGQNFKAWFSSDIGYVAKLTGSFPLGVANTNFQASLDGLISTNFNYPENNAPYVPLFNGPTQVTAGVEHDFTISTIEPNGDDIYYIVDWGDGTIDDWFGPYADAEEVTITHTFEDQADFYCRAKAKDVNGYQTCWADPFIVTAPVNIPEGSQSLPSNQQQSAQQQS